MLGDLVKLYNNDCLRLAKSVIFKSHLFAKLINNLLTEQGIDVLQTAPETWKYYKNLSGEYHFTDLPLMTVVSVDTLETIDFTKENLLIHKATAREYAFGGRYYEELVERFPDKEALIRGILNPIDINTAINAKEGSVLYYTADLVEPAEDNLIAEVEDFIKTCWSRWNTIDYRLTHDLYLQLMKTIIEMFLVEEIKQIRLANCKTNRAHSFHIQMYLASHGRLDRFLNVLSDRQRLYLYRNIVYINNHAGKQSTFQDLVKVLFTERGYPLVGHQIHHNTEGMPASLKPTTEFIQKPINTQRNFGYTKSFTIDEMLDKEDPLASMNPEVKEEYRAVIQQKVELAPFDDLPTKVLESSITDNQSLGIRTLNEMLLDHWMLMSTRNKYLAVTHFTYPVTGEKVIISSRDAFVLFIYAYCKAREITLTTVPELNALLTRRLLVPSRTFQKAVTDKHTVTDADIDKMRDDVTDIPTVVSIDSFYSLIKDYHARLQKHYVQWISEHNKKRRAQLQAAAMRLYALYPCKFYDSLSYSAWFASNGLNFSTVSRYDFERLAVELFRNATGLSLNTSLTLTEIHRSTVELMSQLSSYSVQFITNVSESEIVNAPAPETLIGNCKLDVASYFYHPVPMTEIRNAVYTQSFFARIQFDTWDDLSIKTTIRTNARIDVGMKGEVVIRDKRTLHSPTPIVGIRNVTFNFV